MCNIHVQLNTYFEQNKWIIRLYDYYINGINIYACKMF